MPATAPQPAPDAFDPGASITVLANIEASLSALLTASELHEPDAPAARAYRHAMREATLELAWAGLPGWRS